MQQTSMSMRVGIAALLIALLPGMAAAQQRSAGRGQDLDQTMVELTEQLELNEEQAGQIRKVLGEQNAASRKLIEEARASGQGRAAFGAMRERMEELREDAHAKIEDVLSVEQMARYEEFVTKREQDRQRQRGQRGQRRPPGGQRGS